MPRILLPLAAVLAALAFITALTVNASRGATEGIHARAGHVMAVPASMTVSAAYLTIVNPTGQDVHLTGASTPAAERVVPMHTTHEHHGASGQSMVGMTPAAHLTVPARGELTLTPEGDHLMLEGLREPLVDGQSVELTVRFEGSEPLRVTLPVRRP